MMPTVGRAAEWLRQEPLAHFLMAGLGMFLLYAAFAPKEAGTAETISITATQQRNITALFERTWGRPPTPQEQEGLVAARVREEILAREAVAMGLSEGDAVVRARLAQKLEFLSDDLAATLDPEDAELQKFLEDHQQRYLAGERVSFRHIFLRPLDDGQIDGERAAEILQAADTGGDYRTFGDPTLLPPELTSASLTEIDNTFGAQFSSALKEVSAGAWHSAIRSSFGYHLVFIVDREAPRVPPFAEIRDILVRDWRDVQRMKLREAFYNDVRRRYRVEVDPLPGKSEK